MEENFPPHNWGGVVEENFGVGSGDTIGDHAGATAPGAVGPVDGVTEDPWGWMGGGGTATGPSVVEDSAGAAAAAEGAEDEDQPIFIAGGLTEEEGENLNLHDAVSEDLPGTDRDEFPNMELEPRDAADLHLRDALNPRTLETLSAKLQLLLREIDWMFGHSGDPRLACLKECRVQGLSRLLDEGFFDLLFSSSSWTSTSSSASSRKLDGRAFDARLALEQALFSYSYVSGTGESTGGAFGSFSIYDEDLILVVHPSYGGSGDRFFGPLVAQPGISGLRTGVARRSPSLQSQREPQGDGVVPSLRAEEDHLGAAPLLQVEGVVPPLQGEAALPPLQVEGALPLQVEGVVPPLQGEAALPLQVEGALPLQVEGVVPPLQVEGVVRPLQIESAPPLQVEGVVPPLQVEAAPPALPPRMNSVLAGNELCSGDPDLEELCSRRENAARHPHLPSRSFAFANRTIGLLTFFTPLNYKKVVLDFSLIRLVPTEEEMFARREAERQREEAIRQKREELGWLEQERRQARGGGGAWGSWGFFYGEEAEAGPGGASAGLKTPDSKTGGSFWSWAGLGDDNGAAKSAGADEENTGNKTDDAGGPVPASKTKSPLKLNRAAVEEAGERTIVFPDNPAPEECWTLDCALGLAHLAEVYGDANIHLEGVGMCAG